MSETFFRPQIFFRNFMSATFFSCGLEKMPRTLKICFRCDKQCEEGSFGANCSQTCQCQNGGVCNHISGHCQCAPGWRGKKCNKGFFAWKCFKKFFQFLACTKGFFGQDCAQLCKCPGLEASCDHVTGQCECPPGFKGLQCVEVFLVEIFKINF